MSQLELPGNCEIVSQLKLRPRQGSAGQAERNNFAGKSSHNYCDLKEGASRDQIESNRIMRLGLEQREIISLWLGTEMPLVP